MSCPAPTITFTLIGAVSRQWRTNVLEIIEEDGVILFDVTLSAASENREGLIALLRKTMVASSAEPGCVTYRFTADFDDPLRFHLVELWASEADLLAHAKGAPFRNFLAELPALGKVERSTARQGDLQPYQFARPV
jgi:quinol monooxygenase YgiN